jgi:hypothetical protein
MDRIRKGLKGERLKGEMVKGERTKGSEARLFFLSPFDL